MYGPNAMAQPTALNGAGETREYTFSILSRLSGHVRARARTRHHAGDEEIVRYAKNTRDCARSGPSATDALSHISG